MEHFTPFASTIGGLLIGLSAALMLLFSGRIAGISGILRGVLEPTQGDVSWRVAFIGGLVAGGTALVAVSPELFAVTIDRSVWAIIAAGLLVGFGTRLGNGCTSGHGVCGLSRLSARSMLATASFMATGAITVYIVNHLLGGAL
jgi:uncharacterized membrane protein YedE/YeeE